MCLQVYSCIGVWGCFEGLGRFLVIFFIWVFFLQAACFQGLVLVFLTGFGFFLLFLGRLVDFLQGEFWVLYVPLSVFMCWVLWGFYVSLGVVLCWFVVFLHVPFCEYSCVDL